MVTTDDFNVTDIEAPIRDSRHVDCLSLGKLYKAAAEQKECSNEVAYRVYELLSSILYITLKPQDIGEPYGPVCVFEGRRSLVPSDLRGEQSVILGELATGIRNPGLRARLADIVWLNDKKRADMAREAIMAYCRIIQDVLEGKAQFRTETLAASSKEGCKMLRRACRISHETGRKEPEASNLYDFVEKVIQDSIDQENLSGFFNIGEISLHFRIGDLGSVARNAEKFAGYRKCHPYLSSNLWDLAALAHRQARNKEEHRRCLVAKAETFVEIADVAEARGEIFIAVDNYRNAIQLLRELQNTRQRRTEIEEKLRHAQSSIRDEMGVIATTFDVTEAVKAARTAVSGQSLSQALVEFVCLSESPDPDELRTEARNHAEENPFMALFTGNIVDKDGRTLSESPSYAGDGEDGEDALHHIIIRNEGLRRQHDVQGLIEPARQQIRSEHSLEISDFFPFAEMSPFVPADRVGLVAMGIARFFGGDFHSALHILVPQLENSLRQILELQGLDTSAIQSDMTQEIRPFSVLLKKERETLEKVLGPAIIFEIENLFDYRGGPALRHQLAHGLVTADQCYGSDSIYACWFIFRLFCLPWFRDWESIAGILDNP